MMIAHNKGTSVASLNNVILLKQSFRALVIRRVGFKHACQDNGCLKNIALKKIAVIIEAIKLNQSQVKSAKIGIILRYHTE